MKRAGKVFSRKKGAGLVKFAFCATNAVSDGVRAHSFHTPLILSIRYFLPMISPHVAAAPSDTPSIP